MCRVVEFVGFIAVSYDLLVMCASAFAKHWRSVGQNLEAMANKMFNSYVAHYQRV